MTEMWFNALFIGDNGDAIIGQISTKTILECIKSGGVTPEYLRVTIPEGKDKRFNAMKLESIFIKVFAAESPKGEASD